MCDCNHSYMETCFYEENETLSLRCKNVPFKKSQQPVNGGEVSLMNNKSNCMVLFCQLLMS